MFGKNKSDKNVDLEFFTIYDSKTQTYGNPTQAINKHDLLREVINMFKDPSQAKNIYLTNAEDYSIFKIGSYCKRSGLLESQNLEHIANMHDLRALAQPDPGIVST